MVQAVLKTKNRVQAALQRVPLRRIWTDIPESVRLDFCRLYARDVWHLAGHKNPVVIVSYPDENQRVTTYDKVLGEYKSTHLLKFTRLYITPYQDLSRRFPDLPSEECRDIIWKTRR